MIEIKNRALKYLAFLFLFGVCFCCISCGKEKKEIHAIPQKLPQNYVVNQQVNDVTYIPLAPNPKAYPGEVKKLIILDTLMIVTCVNRSAIYLYDKNGEFLSLIQPKGNGPLEFQSLQDVASINAETLLIADNGLGKIISFSLSSGKPIEEYKLDYAPFALAYSDSLLYVLTNDFDGGVIKTSKLSELSSFKSTLFVNPPFNQINSIQPFWNTGDELFLNASFSDVIYRAEDEGMSPYVWIGGRENAIDNVPDNLLSEAFLARNADARQRIKNVLIPAGDFSCINNIFILRLLNPAGHIFIYDRKTEEAFLFEQESELMKLEMLTGKPYPIFHTIDQEGFVYMSFFPTKDWYESITLLPADDPIRRAAEEGLGDYFGDPAFENPVLVKFRPGEQFLEVE